MYTTCAFCNGTLDGDGGPSRLGVGKRFAFDAWKGRLWVVCGKCRRWNLTPIDDRWEQIEALARVTAQGRITATTENIALIRHGPYDLVRVGRPPRVEFAGWRYGEFLKARQRERLKYVIPISAAAVGLMIAVNAAAGGGMGVFAYNLPRLGESIYQGIIGRRSVTLSEPPICERCGAIMRLKAKHIQWARVLSERQAGLGLLVSCPKCRSEGALLTGRDADVALRQGLTYLNANRTGRKHATRAAETVDGAGGPEGLILRVTREEPLVRSLKPERRLALEMAVDEKAEVEELEREWRQAEEIADIADGMLSTTPELEAHLRRLKARRPFQPDG